MKHPFRREKKNTSIGEEQLNYLVCVICVFFVCFLCLQVSMSATTGVRRKGKGKSALPCPTAPLAAARGSTHCY